MTVRERHIRDRARGDAGVSLVELLVTMTIAVVVLFAILKAADIFGSSSVAADRTADAQETARSTVRSFVGELRQARVPAGGVSPVPVAGPAAAGDLVFASYLADPASPTTDVEGWVRYCTASDATGTSLVRGILRGTAYTAPSSCPRTSGTVGGWTYGVVIADRLVVAQPLFELDSSNCVGGTGPTGAPCTPAPSAVRSVGIRLEILNGGRTTRTTVLRDAVSLRNRN